MAELGEVVGGFRLEEVIGRGGMGVVYRASQAGLGRDVALKIISPALAADPGFQERFRREARLAALVEHPNVLPVYDYGDEGDVLFVAMRLGPGPDLGVLVRQNGPLRPRRAVRIVAQVAGALDAAHRRGLVHRDVKPSNVLVADVDGDDHAYLADFGLARLADADLTVSGEGRWAGTADYAAPEQIRGERGDARTDVYALGGVLHWALTGEVPFPRATQEGKLWAHLNEPPPQPSRARPGLPPRLDAVVARALAKAPGARYATAGALARAARAAIEDVPAGVGADEAPTVVTGAGARRGVPGERPGVFRRPGAVLLGGAVAAIAVAGAIVLAGREHERPERPAGTPPAVVPARGAKPYDFDGDGRQEIAVGLPDLGRTGGRPAGTVVVLRQRGPRLGWERFAAARWRLPGAPRSATTTFGRALASGDFDGDGHADLAVGAAGADLSRGAVLVRYGSRAGLTPGRQRRFSGPAGFGAALAAGDLDRDGYADLVAGVTGDQTNVEEDYGSGSLRIYFGGPSGLTASRRRTIARPRRLDAAFGAKIALGDVDGDDRPDIAEGAPGSPSTEEFGPLPGHAAYCPGGPRGARSCRPMGTEGASGPTALAVGDVTDHQHADIVQGVAVSKRGDELLPVPGQIRLWRGRDGGPAPRPLVITQSTPGVRGSDDPGDRFGAEVAVADLDRDSQGDVVVGVPGEDAGTGRVVVVFGSPRGLSPLPGDLLQEAPPGVRQPGDRFGSGLALMDTTGDNRPELVVSAPGDRGGAGTLSVFRGAGRSFDPARPQVVVLSRFGRGYLRGRTGRVYLGRRNSS